MMNKDLQDLLKQYPDNTPVMVTIQTKRDGDFSCLKFDFTTIDYTSGKTRCIELIGTIEDDE